ncbi:MAG: hypothetical protein ACRCZ2_04120, partial [Fusobacteriaceae bacterium]
NIPKRYFMKTTQEIIDESNRIYAELQEIERYELVEAEDELAEVKREMVKKGFVPITDAKFTSLTHYMHRLLNDDGRTVWSPYGHNSGRGRVDLPNHWSPRDELTINRGILRVRTAYPDCIFFLERVWLEDIMEYAPSTVSAKLSIIRKHQKEGHIRIAERLEQRKQYELSMEKRRNEKSLLQLHIEIQKLKRPKGPYILRLN